MKSPWRQSDRVTTSIVPRSSLASRSGSGLESCDPQPRKPRRQVGDDHLVEDLTAGNAVKPKRPEPPNGYPVRQRSKGLAHRVRDEDLAAIAGAGDAGDGGDRGAPIT